MAFHETNAGLVLVILFRLLQAGQRPSEELLARHSRLGLGPVRVALRQLMMRGWVQGVPLGLTLSGLAVAVANAGRTRVPAAAVVLRRVA